MTDSDYEPDPDADYEAWAEGRYEELLADRQEQEENVRLGMIMLEELLRPSVFEIVSGWYNELSALRNSVDAWDRELAAEFNDMYQATLTLLLNVKLHMGGY